MIGARGPQIQGGVRPIGIGRCSYWAAVSPARNSRLGKSDAFSRVSAVSMAAEKFCTYYVRGYVSTRRTYGYCTGIAPRTLRAGTPKLSTPQNRKVRPVAVGGLDANMAQVDLLSLTIKICDGLDHQDADLVPEAHARAQAEDEDFL